MFLTVVLEKTLANPLDCKEIKLVNPKANNPEYSLKGLMVKLKLQYFGHLNRRARLIRKDPDAGKDWRQEEKGMTEDKMVGWHHWLNGHEFDQAQGNGEEKGSLVCYSPWAHKESDTTELLNNNKMDSSLINSDGQSSTPLCLHQSCVTLTCLLYLNHRTK